MSKRPAPPLDLPAFGIIAGEVTLAASGAEARAPEWIKVTPRGTAPTRDGRSYGFNPEMLAARFTTDAVDVAVDTNHGLALRATRGEDVDPIGYAAELQARDDGLWARINWLDPVAAAATVRKHRYVSPTFFPDAAGQAVWLHSISLVSTPALSMPALLHAFGAPPEPSMKQIAKALGLPETADEAACLAALGARAEVKPLAAALGLPETADAAACLSAIGSLKGSAPELVTQLQGQLATTSAQLQTLMTAQRDKEVADLLESALKERRIVPAQRESLATLCVTDEGLKGVKAMLAATTPGLQPSGLGDRGQPAGGDAVDAVTLSAAAQKIQDEAKVAGRPISFSDAITLAQKKPAA